MSASEQTSASKRDDGFYWVNWEGEWVIAESWLGEWSLLTDVNDMTRKCVDADFLQIDERRIERPSPQQQPDTFVQDETQIVRGPLGPTYATKLVKGQPDELSKAQERQLVSLQKVTDEWHETDERIGFGQFVFKYYDVCRRLEDPKP